MNPPPTRVDIRAGDAHAEIAPDVGGALAAFRYRGRDVMRPTPDDARRERNVRRHACYPLVPYSNRIADARLSFGGTAYTLARNFGDHPHAIHGVGWQRPWTVVDRHEASIRLALEHRPHADAARAWPWPFDAWQSIALVADGAGATLTLVLTIRNAGDEPFPFGLGWHPFFPRDDATVLGLSADGFWQTDATQLPTAHAAATGDRCFDPPRAIGSTALDNVYTGWNGEATLVDAAQRSKTTIRADRGCAFLVVYAPPSRGFVAIEPVTQMTDAFNRADRGERATGTRVLAPATAFSCTMQIETRVRP
jgi:aldose 1-epimerase